VKGVYRGGLVFESGILRQIATSTALYYEEKCTEGIFKQKKSKQAANAVYFDFH
jgi:hypothetical protein